MSFDDILKDDSALYVDPDAFPGVEAFTIHRPGLEDVPTTGPVWRQVPVRDSLGRITFERHVFVRNNAEDSVTTIDEQGYRITMARDFGGSNLTYTVARIVEQDAGGWLLKLE